MDGSREARSESAPFSYWERWVRWVSVVTDDLLSKPFRRLADGYQNGTGAAQGILDNEEAMAEAL